MGTQVVVPEPEPQPTEKANDEAAFFASRERLRSDIRQSHLHRGGLVIFWFGITVGVALFLIWAWHLGAPEKWDFLTAAQIEKLQSILLSAVTSSFGSGVARRWINAKPDAPSNNQSMMNQ